MQVTEDQKLLREKLQHLSGHAGIDRMECALSETRAKYFQAIESGSLTGSSITPFLTPTMHGSPSSPAAGTDGSSDMNQMPNRVVRSLFKEYGTSPSKNSISSAPSSSRTEAQLDSSIRKQLVTENELIVNEFIHEHREFVDSFSVTDKDQNSIKVCAVLLVEEPDFESILGFLALL